MYMYYVLMLVLAFCVRHSTEPKYTHKFAREIHTSNHTYTHAHTKGKTPKSSVPL